MFELFPDLYRYSRQELTKQRVIFGFSLLTLVGICAIAFFAENETKTVADLARFFLFLQAVAWVVWAPAQTSGAVSIERAERTWDFQRLTPLTSFQTAVGKILGAPIFPLSLGLFLVPWSLVLTVFGSPADIGIWLQSQFALIGMAFLSNSIGLLISANATVKHGRASMIVGPVVGIAVLIVNWSLVFIDAATSTTTQWEFYGYKISATTFFFVNMYVFGLWAFIGAKWEIAREYLEQTKPWRIPAFLIFIAVYFRGLQSEKTYSTITLFWIGVFVYVIAAAQTNEDTLSLRQWLKQRKQLTGFSLKHAPIWAIAYFTFAAIVVISAVLLADVLVLPLAFFFLRDLILLDGARSLKFKQSKGSMVWLSVVLYLLPFFLIKILPPTAFSLFMPSSVSAIWNQSEATRLPLTLASSVGQVVIAWFVIQKFESRNDQ